MTREGRQDRGAPRATGRRQGDRVEIVSGVKAGQPVVVEPGNLAGGQPVTVGAE